MRLVSEVIFVSRVDRREQKNGKKKEETKASAQLATSSLMKAVAAIQ